MIVHPTLTWYRQFHARKGNEYKFFLSFTSPSKSFSTALGRGPWDFRFCGFGSVWIGFSVLVFIVVCGFSDFQHLVSVFVRILMDFRIWYSMWCLFILFGFRFLFDLSAGNDAPPLISSTRKTFVCPTSIGLIRVLITGMWKFIGLTVLPAVFGFDWIF